jgi:dienelactone hydrolase
VTSLAKVGAFVAALLPGIAVECLAAESPPTVVEIESPLASPHPLQGYLRQPGNAGPSPAVVLLHSCGGNWARLDQHWGKQIASWGYVTLTVDSFGPRGLTECRRGAPGSAPDGQSLDAFRALNFLVGAPFVDPARVAVLGFARGGRMALMSVEHGAIEQTSPNKFRAAIAFYPDCRAFRGDVTVPTLILIGERDDWSPPGACRDLVDGRDEMGLSRKRSDSAPIKLIVYPGAYHGFDAPGLATPGELSGHHLEFNQSAADQSIAALHEFLDATIGRKE